MVLSPDGLSLSHPHERSCPIVLTVLSSLAKGGISFGTSTNAARGLDTAMYVKQITTCFGKGCGEVNGAANARCN